MSAQNLKNQRTRASSWAVYLAFVTGVVFLSLWTIDTWVLPSLSRQGVLRNSPEWSEEDRKIRLNNDRKIAGSEPVWSSWLHPVVKKKSTARRILVLGDSFVWGDGYSDMNDLWWRQLERELRRRGFDDVEVVGMGFWGWSTHREFDVLRMMLPILEPDCVVWGYCTNDPDEGTVQQLSSTLLDSLLSGDPFVKTMHFLRSDHALPAISQQVVGWRRERARESLREDTAAHGYEYFDWELKLLQPPNFPRFQQTVRDVAAFIDSVDTPIFFVTLPNHPDRAKFAPRLAPVLSLLRENGIAAYDLLDSLVAWGSLFRKPARSWGINPANGHPGRASTRLFARQVADILERDYPAQLPPREPTNRSRRGVINDCVPMGMYIEQRGDSALLRYPEDDASLLRMPFDQPFIQLSLETPQMIRQVVLWGPTLKSARLYVTYDESLWWEVTSLGRKTGSLSTWSLPERDRGRHVSTMRISANFTTPTANWLKIQWQREHP